MTTLNISNIRSGLKGVISNLVTSTTISVVYDYYEPNVSGYPAVVFDITNNSDSFLTTTENLIKITFSAYILVEIYQNGIEDATDLLDTVTDSLIEELRKTSNMSLGGNVDWISPVIGPRSQIETPNGQAFSQQLDIIVNLASTI